MNLQSILRPQWACAAALLCCPLLAKADVVIQNDSLKVHVDAGAATFSVESMPAGKAFVSTGKLAPGGAAALEDVADPVFGKGKGIAVSFPDGTRDEIRVFDGLPFVLLREEIHNAGAKGMTINSLQRFAATVDLGKGVSGLRTLSTAGLSPAETKAGGYEWMAVADPQTRHGVVAGWITDDRASGVILADPQGDSFRFQPQLDYGRLLIDPGKTASTEALAIGYFDDARLGLEAWASTIARVYHIRLHPEPVGYCTWYTSPHGGASDEKHLAELATFAVKNLKPFGFSVVQIDDGWQVGTKKNGPRKVFSAFNPQGPYPSGMKAMADALKAKGLTPGIWFMPFAGTFDDPFFKPHPDWFVKTSDGKPYDTRWGGTCLDMTDAGAREYLRSEVRRISHDWGYTYFKMDGLYTGTAAPQVYVNSGYKQDHLGDAVLSDPHRTNIEEFRTGLQTVRESAGEGVFLLGCCAPQNMRSYGGAFGLVDAMRVGPDNGPAWKSLQRGPLFSSRSYFLNGRVWYNDPDPVYVRDSVPLEHARLICSWVSISGNLNLSSDWLPSLSPERLDVLKRTMPNHGLPSRPVDLFENEPPRIWLLTDDRRQPRRDVVALYNWTSQPLEIDEPLERIGVPGKGPYVGFDFWADRFVPPFEDSLRVTLPKESCQILSLRPVLDHPQLISTSRHVTQGIVDVSAEIWDPKGNRLSGKSKVVGGDPYELRVVTLSAGGKSWKLTSAEVSAEDASAGVKIMPKPSEAGARIAIRSDSSREVSWTLHFQP